MEALCQSPHSALCTFSLWLWKYFPKQREPFQQITKPKRGSSEPPIYCSEVWLAGDLWLVSEVRGSLVGQSSLTCGG